MSEDFSFCLEFYMRAESLPMMWNAALHTIIITIYIYTNQIGSVEKFLSFISTTFSVLEDFKISLYVKLVTHDLMTAFTSPL